MSNEINVKLTITHKNGNRKQPTLNIDHKINQTLNRGGTFTQNIGLTAEAIAIGDVPTGGLMTIVNNDPTHYVSIGITGFTEVCRIPPLESFGPVRWYHASLLAQANTAACDIDVTLHGN